MGEWLMIPGAEEVLGNRISRFNYRRGGHREMGRNRRGTIRRRFDDLLVYVDGNDFANLADVSDAPLWECEMPLTDDGF